MSQEVLFSRSVSDAVVADIIRAIKNGQTVRRTDEGVEYKIPWGHGARTCRKLELERFPCCGKKPKKGDSSVLIYSDGTQLCGECGTKISRPYWKRV